MEKRDYMDVLKKMTLEEKASLCSGMNFWQTKPVERLGVPSVWMTDGPHGLRKEKQDGGGTNIMKPSEIATCFPPAVTTASSWDPDLIREMGNAIAEEARALKVTTVLGPGINIKRSPLCGRNFEYFSEDPYLAGRMGAAWVHGVQEKGVGVSLKHYCANNQEALRMSIDTIVDERALREIYLPAFEHVVKTEQPTTVMCSYNRLNGEYLSDNKRMLTDVLRKEWGFKGIVVSDWGAVNNRTAGIRAGLDLEMPGNKGMHDAEIVNAVKNGSLSESELDKVAYRMLRFAFECKDNETDGVTTDFEAHHALVRKIAAESAVLLKNEDKALPLSRDKSVAVIGALAKHLRFQGSGSSFINAYKKVSFLDALDEVGQSYTYADGYSLKGDGYSKSLIAKAVKAAEGKDAVLVFIGLTDAYESEGFDRKHMNMPDSHYKLVEALKAVNDNIIVVLSCGSPVKLGDIADSAKAVLNLYLGGQAGGHAAYDVLYGAVNPSGKLAETFPLRNHDNIAARYFPMGPRTVEYRESVFVGYRYFDSAKKNVRYPFGHGLSYTTFEYSDLELSSESINEGDELSVSFKVKNTGAVAGAEVAQLYVSDLESSIFRPVRELKGFKKVRLEPGEEKTVTLTLDSRAFAYYNVLIKDWHIESGEFGISVGASSRDLRLSRVVTVISANAGAKIPNYHESAPYYYSIGEESDRNRNIPAEQFAALYGASLIENKPYEKGELTVNNSLEQISVSCVGRLLFRLVTFSSKLIARGSENKEMIVQSVRDMPLRSASGFSGGVLTTQSVEGIVDMCNGVKGGFKKFRAGFKKKKANSKEEPSQKA